MIGFEDMGMRMGILPGVVYTFEQICRLNDLDVG
jgi:hypothetical protein